MSKKQNYRRLSMGMLFLFLFAVLLPVGAAMAAGCEITTVPQSRVKPGSDPQDLGYVKITAIESCDFIQVEVTLPDGVEWDNPMSAGSVGDYIFIKDENGSTIDDGLYIDADEYSYTVRFDNPAMFEDKAQIRAVFNDVLVSHSASDDIILDIVVTAVEDGLTTWRVVSPVDKADYDVNASCEKAPVVYTGNGQAFGKITLSENAVATFRVGDRMTLTLPEGCEWEKVTATASKTGLEAKTELKGKQLNIVITKADSSKVKNSLILNGALEISPLVPAGNLSVDIKGDLDKVDYENSKLIIAAKDELVSKLSIGSMVQYINGKSVTMDAAPYIRNDRTYLPVRYVCYGLGMSEDNILWDPIERTVTIHQGDTTVQLTIGSKTGKINGVNQQLDTAPEITSDRTMLPVRFIAEAFGASVTWDPVSQTVEIAR